jgi:nucleotide-binding universal stress UspA family protein
MQETTLVETESVGEDVAEKFIRQATTPVLLVRGPAKG